MGLQRHEPCIVVDFSVLFQNNIYTQLIVHGFRRYLYRYT